MSSTAHSTTTMPPRPRGNGVGGAIENQGGRSPSRATPSRPTSQREPRAAWAAPFDNASMIRRRWLGCNGPGWPISSTRRSPAIPSYRPRAMAPAAPVNGAGIMNESRHRLVPRELDRGRRHRRARRRQPGDGHRRQQHGPTSSGLPQAWSVVPTIRCLDHFSITAAPPRQWCRPDKARLSTTAITSTSTQLTDQNGNARIIGGKSTWAPSGPRADLRPEYRRLRRRSPCGPPS